MTVLEERDGFLSFLAEGKDAHSLFQNEPGGHRFQRIPPTERKGRVHTSTVTVAVLPVPVGADAVRESDVDYRTTKSSSKGGQHANKTESAVIATHLPTGIQVRCEDERSQHKNKAKVLQLLSARVAELQQARLTGDRNAVRKAQVGSGMRGDKVRTVRTQDDRVTCEATGRTKRLKAYERGEIWFD